VKLFYKAALAAAFTVTSVVGLAVTPASANGSDPYINCRNASAYGACFYELDNYGGTPEYPSEFGLGECHTTTQVNHSAALWLTDTVDGEQQGGEVYVYQNTDCTGIGTGLGGLSATSVASGFHSYCITRTYPFLTCTP
jgi:hypothetical protein